MLSTKTTCSYRSVSQETNSNKRKIIMKRIIQSKLTLGFIFFLGLFPALLIHAETESMNLTSQSTCGNVDVAITPSTATYNDVIEAHITISNNQCVMSSLGFDLFYDASMFSYIGLDTLNCLTADWSMLDGNEINPGQVRIGGYSGSGTNIPSAQNGIIVKVKFQVICRCDVCSDGQQSSISINSFQDDLSSYIPQPAQDLFTLECCGGDISLPTDMAGVWGSLIHIPVNVANNYDQICDFEFDFVFDPAIFEFRGLVKTAATQNWTNLAWNLVETGKARVSASVGSGTCIPALSDAALVRMQVMVRCVGYSSDTYTPIMIESYKNGIASFCPRAFETDFLNKACPRLGDVNGDGNLTPGDAQKAFEIYLGTLTPTFSQLTTADANCHCPCDGMEHTEENNCITPGDAQWIFEHYLMKRTLPLCAADYNCPDSSDAALSETYAPFHETLRLYPLPTSGEPGEKVNIPVIVNNPSGIHNFGLEMFYPCDLLEYVGLLASPLTQNFDYLRGEEEVPGVVRVEGKAVRGIPSKVTGSLCVAVFNVKEGVSGKALIELFNLTEDIYEAEVGSGDFRVESPQMNEGTVTLEKYSYRAGVLVIPIKVNNVYNLRAFGLELKFNTDKLTFVGLEQTELTEDFVTVEGTEIEPGVIRLGGFSMNGVLGADQGVLLNLFFQEYVPGGEVEITRIYDDLKDFMVIK